MWIIFTFEQTRNFCLMYKKNDTFRVAFKKCCNIEVVQKIVYVNKETGFKALVNEDTLLQTHCCPRCFLGCANWETFVADTKCFWAKSETFLCPGHKICVHNKYCWHGQTGKHLCRQQCVCNNVSLFASTFRPLVPFAASHENPFSRAWPSVWNFTRTVQPFRATVRNIF